MHWILLLLAALFEIAWAIGLKYSEGFSRPLPTTLTIISLIISFALLGLATRTLPIGTAYAIWTGIGAAGTAIAGMILFHDPATTARLACISLILAGVIGLKIAS